MDPRPLITHVVYRFDTGGLENIVASLINGLPADVYRHAVLSLTQITDFKSRIERDDVELITLNKPAGHALKIYPRLYRELRRLRACVLHTCNLAALEAVVPAFVAGVPVRVHAEHGFDVHDMSGARRKYRFLRKAYRPFVSHYIAVSEPLARYMSQHVGVSAQRLTLIRNGVDMDRFTSKGDATVPSFPFDSESTWVIGTVGRMQQVKNQTLLARAFVEAIRSEPMAGATLRLVLIGDGPLRVDALDILHRAGADHLVWAPGELQDIPSALRKLDCFVLPSLSEGTSCTLQEAMATGLPVIATDVGGNRDLISPGNTGLLVPSGDVTGMARAILTYWRNQGLAKSHGSAARRVACQSFGLPTMLEAYDRVFRQLIGARPKWQLGYR